MESSNNTSMNRLNSDDSESKNPVSSSTVLKEEVSANSNSENVTKSHSSGNKESSGDKKPTRPNYRNNYRNNKFRNNKFFYRKKFCYFKKNNINYIDYKDIDVLKRFVGRAGQITSPRFTGTSHKYQRKLSNAIKRARFMALLPYVGYIERYERPKSYQASKDIKNG